ncbi:MAG: PorV/PorQ family protein, partial [Calditrichae bacterium]|nr:PorV/PorQ family protein [Calditrichia bacterium]
MKKLLNKLFLMLVLMLASVNAQSENEGKTGMAFLKVGVGARAAGMGEAFTAVASDAYATYWNPAGLLAATNSNLGFMHNSWFESINSEFGALQFKSKQSSIALHVYSFNVGDIQVRTIPSEDPLEETSAHYISAGVSYARSFSDHLGLGITLKYLYEKIFVYSAGGIGVDLGFRYTGLTDNVVVAGAIQNLGKMGEFQSESTELPKIVRLGGQYKVPGTIGPVTLLLAGDVVKPLEENARIHLGTEFKVWSQLILRSGYAAGYEAR